MKIPNIIELLQTFSTKEIERFSHFVESRYFNTDTRILHLLNALINNVLNKGLFDSAAQVKVYQTVFKDKNPVKEALNSQQKKWLSAKMSVLMKLTQRFLTIEAIAESPVSKSELLNKKLLEKKQFKLIDRFYEKKKQELVRQKEKGMEYYALNFQIEMDKMNCLYQKGVLVAEDNFSALMTSMDLRYLINKLELQIIMQSVCDVTNNKSYDFTTIKAIAPLLTLPDYANNPLITLCRTVIELMEKNEEATLLLLLELLEKYYSVIPDSYLTSFYSIACNFCARKIRMGQVNYNQKCFDLYKIMDSKALLMEKDFLQIVKLKNIVALSCKVSEFGWAKEAVAKYCPFVNQEIAESVRHCNLGIIEFYQSNYKAAINHLIRVDKVNLTYDLDCRILLLKSHYELDQEYDYRTMTIFRSAEGFVHTNKTMPTTHKKSYKNFIQILINLYRLRHRIGKITLDGIKNKLEKMDFVSDKKWLLDKIIEFRA